MTTRRVTSSQSVAAVKEKASRFPSHSSVSLANVREKNNTKYKKKKNLRRDEVESINLDNESMYINNIFYDRYVVATRTYRQSDNKANLFLLRAVSGISRVCNQKLSKNRLQMSHSRGTISKQQ